MLSIADQALWTLTTLLEALVVYLFIIQGLFRKFALFDLYFLLTVATSIGRCAALFRFGLASLEYAYCYFYTDALRTLLLFLSIFEISVRLFGARMLRRVASIGVVALLATAWFSYSVVSFRSS